MMKIDKTLLKKWPKYLNSFLKLSGILILILLGVANCSANNSKSENYIAYNDSHSDPTIMKKIESHYNTWRNTPYRYGGDSLKGIDCSGLVMNFYSTKMNYPIPRVTAAQTKLGKEVSQAIAGDLVFFKTGKGKTGLHVGIYYKDGQFLHVSTKKGVLYSSLSEPYWKEHYWMTKRIVSF